MAWDVALRIGDSPELLGSIPDEYRLRLTESVVAALSARYPRSADGWPVGREARA